MYWSSMDIWSQNVNGAHMCHDREREREKERERGGEREIKNERERERICAQFAQNQHDLHVEYLKSQTTAKFTA